MTNTKISGRVIDNKTHEGICNFRIEAWHNDKDQPQYLGKASTNADGIFQIKLTPFALASISRSGNNGRVFFKIFRAGETRPIKSTDGSIECNPRNPEARLTIEIDSSEKKTPLLLLSKGICGARIAPLHKELKQLGYKIPNSEPGKKFFFNEGTRKVPIQFQFDHQLDYIGITADVTTTTTDVLLKNIFSQKAKQNFFTLGAEL